MWGKIMIPMYWLWLHCVCVLRGPRCPRKARTKWPPFSRHIFKRIFLNGNVCISINISLKFVPRGPINNTSALVQIMTRHRPGDKPLSEPMMVRLPTHISVTRPRWVKLNHSLIQVALHRDNPWHGAGSIKKSTCLGSNRSWGLSRSFWLAIEFSRKIRIIVIQLLSMRLQ